MNRILVLLASIFLFIDLPAQPKHEIRAAWITTNFGLDWPSQTNNSAYTQRKEFYDLLDKLKNANFNMVFIQVRLRGDVIYPSKIEPKSKFINYKLNSGEQYDPLAFVIKACHDRGLECHAWFVVYPMGTTIRKWDKTLSKNNAIKKFGNEYYLDPGNPVTNRYLFSLIREITENYDIDGIHFDYIRYPDKSDKFPDRDSYEKSGTKQSLSDWRRANINNFVHRSYDLIKSLKPWVQVSSSVLGMYKKISGNNQAHWTAYGSVYQDPADWLKNEKHDFIVPMMYYSDDLFYPFINDWLSYANGKFIVPGIGLYKMDKKEEDWSCDQIINQIDFSRKNKTHGNAYFRAGFLVNDLKKITTTLLSDLYKYPAQLPALTWLDSIPPSKTQKPDAIADNNLLHLSWNENDGEHLYYNVYRSETYPVDIENPENLIRTRIDKPEYFLFIDKNKEIGHYYIITACDRYHNESISSDPVYFCTGNFEK